MMASNGFEEIKTVRYHCRGGIDNLVIQVTVQQTRGLGTVNAAQQGNEVRKVGCAQ